MEVAIQIVVEELAGEAIALYVDIIVVYRLALDKAVAHPIVGGAQTVGVDSAENIIRRVGVLLDNLFGVVDKVERMLVGAAACGNERKEHGDDVAESSHS